MKAICVRCVVSSIIFRIEISWKFIYMSTNECQLAQAFPSSIQVELTKSLKVESREGDLSIFGSECDSMMTPRNRVRVRYRRLRAQSIHVIIVRMRKHDGDSSGQRTQIIRIVSSSRSKFGWQKHTNTLRTHNEGPNHRDIYFETYAKNIQNSEYHADFRSDEKSEVQKQKIQIYVIALRIRSKSDRRTESRRAPNNNNSDDYHWRMRNSAKKKVSNQKSKIFFCTTWRSFSMMILFTLLYSFSIFQFIFRRFSRLYCKYYSLRVCLPFERRYAHDFLERKRD